MENAKAKNTEMWQINTGCSKVGLSFYHFYGTMISSIKKLNGLFFAFCHSRFVAGVIKREKIIGFERLLWRACRGNVFFKQTEIDEALYDPTTGDLVHKSVFIIFFQGEQLKVRVKKICEG